MKKINRAGIILTMVVIVLGVTTLSRSEYFKSPASRPGKFGFSQGQSQMNKIESITQLKFITQEQTIIENEISSVITIQTQNKNGHPEDVSEDVLIRLVSQSPEGEFSQRSSPFSPVGYVTIFAGTNHADFYYRDSVIGTHTIMALESPSRGWTPDSQQIIVINTPEDLIVDGGDVTVEGGWYLSIVVKNDGKLTINGETWANEIVLRWGEMTVNGNVHVAENVTIEPNVGRSVLTINGNLNVTQTIIIERIDTQFNTITVYGNNNSANQIDVYGRGIFYPSGTWRVGNMHIYAGGIVDINSQNSWPESGQFILYCDQLIVEAGGTIDGDEDGNDGRGDGRDWYGDDAAGGYGGKGGRGYWDSSKWGGYPYGDDFSLIIDKGSKGGYWGGGMLTIVASQRITVNGNIHLDGGNNVGNRAGGGSGGGILLISPEYEVNAKITADGGSGGDGVDDLGGGGGGGRIKIFYNGTITTDDIMDNLSVKGGNRGGYLNTQPGQPGTIWIDAIPEEPILIQPQEGAVLTDDRPTFKFTVEDTSVTTDHRDDDLSCIIELSTDNFRTIARTYDQNMSVQGWSDYSYKSGDIAGFTPSDPLTKGVRYQWRAYTKDRSIQSQSSEIRSFIIKLSPEKIESGRF